MFTQIMNLIFISSTIALPALPGLVCMQKLPSCDEVICGTNQECIFLSATRKACASVTCKDMEIIEPIIVPTLPCPTCEDCDGECVFVNEITGSCPTPICRKAVTPIVDESVPGGEVVKMDP
jgi:hypothetical protein